MLYTIDKIKIEYIPHKKEYDIWRNRLSNDDYNNIMAAIKKILDTKKVETSSFVPGNDWTDTPYEPIYDACYQNQTHAGYFFGLLMWEAVINHHDEWMFIKTDEQVSGIKGTIYFKCEN